MGILIHNYHQNIHNNIDNNNNTVSATHTQKKKFLPTPKELPLYATILYPTLQAIFTVEKATLSNNFV